MVILQPSFPSINVSSQAKRPGNTGSDCIHEKRSLKLHSTTLPPSLFISNSQKSQTPTLLFPPPKQSVAAIVFGDGQESSQLYPLTKRRSQGAIPIAANYRLIDSVVSNCISSNINHIYALTQFNSTSLNSHLSRAYSGIGLGNEGFVEVIAAYQSPANSQWFQGTADAVRRCLWMLEEYPMTEFLVLPGHHLYRMDYQRLIKAHRDNKADITVAASISRKLHNPGFGFLDVDSEHQVIEFRLKLEGKPINAISAKRTRKSKDTAQNSMTSMGIYLINRDIMKSLLEEHFPNANDFASEVIPGAISIGMKVQTYAFDGYWEDMRNIEAFYQANMQSTKDAADVGYNFYDRESPVYTLRRCLPPTHITDSVITNSVIGDGCILNGCRIKDTVVGTRTRIGDGAIIEDSVIMGSTIYQSETEIGSEKRKGMATPIPIGIGEDTQVRKAIIDKNARIGKNVMIINKDNAHEADREANGYVIRDGIVVVLRSAVIPDGTVL